MKITKSRLLEIIKEEVALFNHSKQKQELYEFNMADLVEMLDKEEPADKDGDNELSDKEQKAVINKEVENDEAVGNLEEVADELEEKKIGKVISKTYKGEKYKTTPGLAAVAKGEKHPKTAVAKAASSWAKEPYAVAQATKIATTGSPKEEVLFDPKTKKELKPKK
jgi:hypothetical protein